VESENRIHSSSGTGVVEGAVEVEANLENVSCGDLFHSVEREEVLPG
jgi:hypothetical protein